MTSIDFDRVQRFLVDDALPFWGTEGTYDNGCFVEHLDLAGCPVDPGYTRIRAQARQIYVFSHAQHMGLLPASDRLARSVDFFIRSAWLGADRGWARRITKHGALVDGDYDLYDVSFALFALGWHYLVARDPRCLTLAHETLDFMQAHARHPLGGFHNDQSRSLPRQQNPHMHLVEALNVWLSATGEARFAEMAESILQLFETRFCDSQSGALFEFFNEDWSRLAGPTGQIVEPGHQFEWAWIIGKNGQMAGKLRPDLMRRLIDSALRAGFDHATGLTVDQVDGEGRVLVASHRLWPQTEAIKAALAEHEFLGVDTRARIDSILNALFERFLDPGPQPGTWIDHYDAQWTSIVDKVPSTSLYHITLAFLELLRLKPSLTRIQPV